MKLAVCLFAGVALLPVAAVGQEADTTRTQNGTLNVFLDCRFHCDFDHFRREVPWVNYMRDRRDAQVHVLATQQQTGGGREYTFNFIGLKEFAGRQDTIVFNSSNTDTDDERRDGFVRTFKLGLIRYVAGTRIADRITIGYEVREEDQVETALPEDDPWDFWVFRTRVGGNLSEESQQSRVSVNGSFSANRTTEALKIEISTFGRYSRDVFALDDTTDFINTSQFYNGDAVVVFSLNDHWSAGGRARASRSTFRNQDLRLGVGPGLEYNLFPYRESTRRQFTFLLTTELTYLDYEQITLFERTEETRVQSNLEVGYSVRQPWGSIGSGVGGSVYLHDLDRHRLDVFMFGNFRLVRGLNLNLFGSFARIKDQIHLPLEDIPEEEILTRRRQLGTDFRVDLNVGLSYTFGSIFNNVVNPRMDDFD